MQLSDPVDLPELLDILIVGGGPGGTAAAFRAKELGLAALVIDFDDLMKRIRDYAKDKLIIPAFGGGDHLEFPEGGKLIARLSFTDIDKDDMCAQWKQLYYEFSVPAQIGAELTGLEPGPGQVWQVTIWNHNLSQEQTHLARHVILAVGKGVPRRFDIPGNSDGIVYRLSEPDHYLGAPACVVGGGTSAAEAVIAISNAKAASEDSTPVFWSYRGHRMPRVSKALADDFFGAYLGNGNVRYFPKSEPVAIVTSAAGSEYLAIRTESDPEQTARTECRYLEFPKKRCVACIGEDMPEKFLASMAIHLRNGGTSRKKRMTVNAHLETQQPGVFVIGDLLSPSYLEIADWAPENAPAQEVKHRGNIKAALCDGVAVVEHIHRKQSTGSMSVPTVSASTKAKHDQPVPPEPKPETHPTTPAGEALTQACIKRLLPGEVEEAEYPIKPNGITTIGRVDCDICLPGDTTLSDFHASLASNSQGFFLRDEGSKTGIFIKSAAGVARELPPDTTIKAGAQFLTFVLVNGSGFLQQGQTGSRHSLSDRFTVFGREAEVVLDVSDLSLSRRHFAAAERDGFLVLKDLGSANGIFIKIRDSLAIAAGDRFRIGQQLFYLSHPGYGTPAGVGTMLPPDDHQNGEAGTVSPTVEPDALLNGPGDQLPESTAQTSATQVNVYVENLGKTVEVPPGATLCQVAEKCGYKVKVECGIGVCGSDPVKVLAGSENLSSPSDEELETLPDICDLEPGPYRLACKAEVTGDVRIEFMAD